MPLYPPQTWLNKLEMHLGFVSYRTIDRSVFKPIVQIAVIENSESLDCQLLAVTHAGTFVSISAVAITNLMILGWEVYDEKRFPSFISY